jgi:hypothetical protein
MKRFMLAFLILLFATLVKAEETKSFNDDIMYSVTVEKGQESELQYGYFYATKPWTDKFSTTYSASVAIDSAYSDHTLDMYSQTVNLSYTLGKGVSVYLLNDIDPHFRRTETWTGITYSWTGTPWSTK